MISDYSLFIVKFAGLNTVCIAPLFLRLGTRWMGVFNCTPGKLTEVPFEYDTVCAPEPGWIFRSIR
jgi:hypothetical protein